MAKNEIAPPVSSFLFRFKNPVSSDWQWGQVQPNVMMPNHKVLYLKLKVRAFEKNLALVWTCIRIETAWRT